MCFQRSVWDHLIYFYKIVKNDKKLLMMIKSDFDTLMLMKMKKDKKKKCKYL